MTCGCGWRGDKRQACLGNRRSLAHPLESKLKSILLKSTLIALYSHTSTHRTHTHLGLGGYLKSYGAGSGSQFSVVIEHFALDKGSSLSLQPYTSAYASARSTSTRGRAGHQSPGHNGGTILRSWKALRECLQAGRANALLQCQCRPTGYSHIDYGGRVVKFTLTTSVLTLPRH